MQYYVVRDKRKQINFCWARTLNGTCNFPIILIRLMVAVRCCLPFSWLWHWFLVAMVQFRWGHHPNDKRVSKPKLHYFNPTDWTRHQSLKVSIFIIARLPSVCSEHRSHKTIRIIYSTRSSIDGDIYTAGTKYYMRIHSGNDPHLFKICDNFFLSLVWNKFHYISRNIFENYKKVSIAFTARLLSSWDLHYIQFMYLVELDGMCMHIIWINGLGHGGIFIHFSTFYMNHLSYKPIKWMSTNWKTYSNAAEMKTYLTSVRGCRHIFEWKSLN